MPMVMPTKRLAIAAALRMCADLDPAQATIVRVLDTLHLRRVWFSRPALALVHEPYTMLHDFAAADFDRGYD
jgi:hypothetical protein